MAIFKIEIDSDHKTINVTLNSCVVSVFAWLSRQIVESIIGHFVSKFIDYIVDRLNIYYKNKISPYIYNTIKVHQTDVFFLLL